MQNHRGVQVNHRGVQNHDFRGGGAGGFGRGRFGRDEERDRDTETFSLEGRRLTRTELREEFEPEITDEKRNEWLKWIDERSKRYSIEPVIINRFSKDDFDYHPDFYVYCTAYGTLEVQEQLVENYVTKPVGSILQSRAKRNPLVISPVSYGPYIYSSTDSPTKKYNLMDLFLNQKIDYKEFCEDLYENYQEIDRGYNQTVEAEWDHVWFDTTTDELCLKLGWSKTQGKNLLKMLQFLNLIYRNFEIQIIRQKIQTARNN